MSSGDYLFQADVLRQAPLGREQRIVHRELVELRERARLAAIENATIARRLSELLGDGQGNVG